MASSKSKPQFAALVSVCIFVGSLVVITTAGSSINKAYETIISQAQQNENERVINLPGQPSDPLLSHFSGYITVNHKHGRALFYWFFEAQCQPSIKPLLLWFNGGPGCSSIGYGAAAELGPLRVNARGDGLQFNPHAWNKEANLLFVESPVGVGFSYTNTSSDLTHLDDGFVAEDAYNFLVNWMRRFPRFKSHDFFISGESYAGHYVPQLAELVFDRNKERTKYPYINLKGFIVGNPETEDSYDYKGILEYAWSHTIISDQEFAKAKESCNFKLPDWSKECNAAMSVVFANYREIDIYNIYAQKCLLNGSSAPKTGLSDDSSSSEVTRFRAQRYGLGKMRILGGYDPCYSESTERYFNREDVQKSFHAANAGRGGSGHVKWKVCNDSIFYAYNYTVSSVLPIYRKLIKAGLSIWVYSGDADGRVPVIGSRYWIEALGLPLKSPWRPWYHNHQVGGRVVEYEGLTFATVRGAGHLVPLNKPSEALSLIRSFLSGQHLPAHR
ncbi:serine carboxypeptidase-like 26 isoform X2 [Diospyros lotus]|uniref:serine carboxypeptidase-like 26 isoform X2 n=1 Tax=Diospyros lotus TaxID=55363 RepID=UPI0022561A2A|nr:serine carboxypeptidase-like 26 isoform X2 [Diospyros lotus]